MDDINDSVNNEYHNRLLINKNVFDMARKQKWKELLKYMQKNDIDYNIKDQHNIYLLEYVVFQNQIYMVDYLLKKNLDFVSGCRFPLRNKKAMPILNRVGNIILNLVMSALSLKNHYLQIFSMRQDKNHQGSF